MQIKLAQLFLKKFIYISVFISYHYIYLFIHKSSNNILFSFSLFQLG